MSRFAEDIARIREELASGGSAGAGPRFAEDVDAIRRDLQNTPPPSPDTLGLVDRMPLAFTADMPERSTPRSDGLNTRLENNRTDPPIQFDAAATARQAIAGSRSFLDGLPVVGPAIRGGTERGAAFLRSRIRPDGRSYEEELAHVQGIGTRAQQEFPATSTTGQVAGQVVGTGAVVAQAPTAFGLRVGAGVAERVALGAGSNAALVTADSLARGHSPEETAGQAATAALAGGLVSGVVAPLLARIPAVAERVRDMGSRAYDRIQPRLPAAAQAHLPARSNLPSTLDELEAAAHNMYAVADRSGVLVRPASFQSITRFIDRTVRQKGYDPRLHPHIAPVLQIQAEVAAAGQPVSLRQLETLRRQALPITRSVAPELADERRIAGIVVRSLDDYTAALKPAQIVSGVNPSTATDALRQARGYWRRASVADRIQTAMERAERHSAGIATGVRAEFRTLANDKRFMRGLASGEKEAVKELASITNFRSLLTLTSRLLDPHRNALTAGVSLGGAGFVGGLPAAAAGYAIGRGATFASDRVMRGRALAIQRGVIQGKTPRGSSQTVSTLAGAFGLGLSK